MTRIYIRLQAALLWETKVSFVAMLALGWSENRHFHTVSATEFRRDYTVLARGYAREASFKG